jgi:hypothetical protein
MKLYDVPDGSRIRLKCDTTEHPIEHRDFAPEEELLFHHIDGMYSYCTDKNGKPVHLKAYAEVEIIGKKIE